MINFILNRIKNMLKSKCNCKVKEWTNDRFDFTDHTLLTYRGFKTEYKDTYVAIKTGDGIQEFMICKYCRHFRCKKHFGHDKTMQTAIRKCCFDCLEKEKIKRNKNKFKYSILEKNYVNENGLIVKSEEMAEYYDTKMR